MALALDFDNDANAVFRDFALRRHKVNGVNATWVTFKFDSVSRPNPKKGVVGATTVVLDKVSTGSHDELLAYLNDTDGLYIYTFIEYTHEGRDAVKLVFVSYAPDGSTIDTRYLMGANATHLKEKTQPNVTLAAQDKDQVTLEALIEKAKETK
jgi:hypothetical protein